MENAQRPIDTQANLTDLQEETFTFIGFMAGSICLIWFLLAALLQPFQPYPPSFWLGLAILILSVTIGALLKSSRLKLASLTLIGGILITVTCLLWAFPSPLTACLFVIPIIFAGALLNAEDMFGVAAISSLVSLTIGIVVLWQGSAAESGPFFVAAVALIRRLLAGSFLVPIGIIALTAMASWGASRNWHTALAWVWHSYERAKANEHVARQNQAELTRVLKSLDNALYRLERANFESMLARNHAEEARRVKQQFAQNISHELRTPLNLIVSFSELMTQSPEYYGGPPPFPYMRDLAIVHRNASHLQSLVNDVLDLARIEAAQMIILPEETDPENLVKEAIETVRSLVESSNLTLIIEIEPDLPPLWIDPTRIRQVLYNLINNAVRFTDEGSVTMSVSQENDDVVFSVKDTGVGITPEDIPRIFEEFQQVDGGRRRQHEGAGLGLVISKRFVELHGGRIWVESQAGAGSAFFFSLPAGLPYEGNTSTGFSALSSDHMTEMGREEPLLLAVTRSPLAVALLTRHVQRCHTIVVQTLEQAQKAVKQSMPQAIVIDNACETLTPLDAEELAKEWGLQRTPVMVCPLPSRQPLHTELSVEGYLLKPVTRRNLADIMRPLGDGLDRILLIDDDLDFVLLLSRLLEDNPVRRYRVLSAHSGEEGLSLVRQRPPDLVFLNLKLPDMHGYEFIECIRANSLWHHIPIVIVSTPEVLGEAEMPPGAMTIAKADGLKRGEVIAWVQDVLDSTIAVQ